MEEAELPRGDPRILESPVGASLELARLTAQRLPGIRRRNLLLLLLGAFWSAAMLALAVLTVGFLVEALDGGIGLSPELVVYVSLAFLLVPMMGLGLALLLMAYKERQFLPFLDNPSRALLELEEGCLVGESTAAMPETGPAAGSPLEGILGSALWAGRLVPNAERMALVARAVLGLLLLGLAYLLLLVLAGLLGGFSPLVPAAELAVPAAFAVPAVLVFKRLSRDLHFYRYYSRRQRAISDAAGLGSPPVPGGEDPLERFDRFLRGSPAVRELLAAPGGGVEDGPSGAGSRLYHGTRDGAPAGFLVRVLRQSPDKKGLDGLLDDARTLGGKRGIGITRAVALVAAGVEDIDDAVYDHVIELGRLTRPGDCALQVVMEVGGAYSMVPFVAD